jgi:TonB family protein
MEYAARNFGYTPLMVRRLFTLLDLWGDSSEFIAEKQKNRTENGVALVCIQAQRKNYGIGKHEFCVDAASHDLLSDEWHGPNDTESRQQFADYFDFSGTRYPRRLEFSEKGKKNLSANLISFKSTPSDPALLVIPNRAIERRYCPGIKPPEEVKRFMPMYRGEEEFEGATTASLTVLADGSVGDVQIIDSGGRTMDQMTVAALKKWKFKPAMCGADPVVSDYEFEFHIQHD